MEKLIKILQQEGCSLVMNCKNERDSGDTGCHIYNGKGVSDLFQLLNGDDNMLEESRIADKVVGKGAAALMILGKVREVYAGTISEPALEMLRSYGVPVSYGQLVPNIINRKGDGICPVETLCLDCDTPEECFPRISDFIQKQK